MVAWRTKCQRLQLRLISFEAQFHGGWNDINNRVESVPFPLILSCACRLVYLDIFKVCLNDWKNFFTPISKLSIFQWNYRPCNRFVKINVKPRLPKYSSNKAGHCNYWSSYKSANRTTVSYSFYSSLELGCVYSFVNLFLQF